MTDILYHCLPWNKEIGWPAQQAKITTSCIMCNEATVELNLDVPEGCLEISFNCPVCHFPRSPLFMNNLPKKREPEFQQEFTLLTEWDSMQRHIPSYLVPLIQPNSLK